MNLTEIDEATYSVEVLSTMDTDESTIMALRVTKLTGVREVRYPATLIAQADGMDVLVRDNEIINMFCGSYTPEEQAVWDATVEWMERTGRA